MDIVTTIAIVVVAFLAVYIFSTPMLDTGAARRFQRPPAPIPTRTRRERLQRRRRNSGGFYPCGYDGPYERDETLVDYEIWSGILNALTTEEVYSLGEFGAAEEMVASGMPTTLSDDNAEFSAVEGMTAQYAVNNDTNLRTDEHPHPVEVEYFETIEDTPASSGWGSSSDDDGGWDSED